jgi:hypothetical protein
MFIYLYIYTDIYVDVFEYICMTIITKLYVQTCKTDPFNSRTSFFNVVNLTLFNTDSKVSYKDLPIIYVFEYICITITIKSKIN